ncbi:MAG: hypothetical protein ACKOSQ_05380 [Planctomycetaceae bacterium]
MSGSAPDLRAGAAGPDAAPEQALSDVWVLLDELPRAAPSAALTATTIEMAAVAVAGGTRGGTTGRPAAAARAWLRPAAVVALALVGGVVAGRLTAPDPDRMLIGNLPLVRHLDVLLEAGSVTFLEAAAGRGGPPLLLVLRQGPEAARQSVTAFNAKLDSLGRLMRADAAARRAFVAGLADEERAELERAGRDFTALSTAERKTLAAVADALVDPDREPLRDAARDWHRWLAASRPEDRDDIIASHTDKRLEWIDWYAARAEGRGRAGQPDRAPPDRPPGRWPPGGEGPRGFDGRYRRPQPPRDGPGRDGPPREGRSTEGPPRDGPPRPVRPDRPAPPPETPSPPG